jgi:hypothetical protein
MDYRCEDGRLWMKDGRLFIFISISFYGVQELLEKFKP